MLPVIVTYTQYVIVLVTVYGADAVKVKFEIKILAKKIAINHKEFQTFSHAMTNSNYWLVC